MDAPASRKATVECPACARLNRVDLARETGALPKPRLDALLDGAAG